MATPEFAATAGVNVHALDNLVLQSPPEYVGTPPADICSDATHFCMRFSSGKSVFTDDFEFVINNIPENKSIHFWLDCAYPSIPNLAEICLRAFGGLHPLTLDILKQPPQSLKQDIFQELKGYTFTTFGYNNAFILFENGLISLSREGSCFRTCSEKRLGNLIAEHPKWMLHALISKLTRQSIPITHQLDKDTSWVNENVYVSPDELDGQSVLDRLADTRSKVVSQVQQMRSRLIVVEALSRRWGNEEIDHYFDDVKDSLITMKNRLEAHESLLGNTHRNWMAVTQMVLEKTKSKVLVVVSEFLALTTVFVPMVTVFTAGHMNLFGPGMDVEGMTTLGWFFLICGCTVGIAALIVFFANRYFRRIMKAPVPSLSGN